MMVPPFLDNFLVALDFLLELRCDHWSRAVLSGSYLGRIPKKIHETGRLGPKVFVGDQVEGSHDPIAL